MSSFDDEFNSPPRRNKRDAVTGKLLPSNTENSKSSTHNAKHKATQSGEEYSRTSSYKPQRPVKQKTINQRLATAKAILKQSSNAQHGSDNHIAGGISGGRDSNTWSSEEEGVQQATKKSSRPQKTLLMRGIDYLSRREHSAHELRRKLAPYAESEEELETTLARLQKENWQNDERFVRTFTQSKQAKWGTSKVLYALQSHQLEAEELEEVREQLRETEYDRALEVYQRKFRTSLQQAPDYQREYAKRVRFMMSRGFNAEVVRKVLKTPVGDEGEE